MNTSSTFQKDSAALVWLVTDETGSEPLHMVVAYTDMTGIAGYCERGTAPTIGKSPLRLLPWASVESVLLVPRTEVRDA